jgi:hypothetical protein
MLHQIGIFTEHGPGEWVIYNNECNVWEYDEHPDLLIPARGLLKKGHNERDPSSKRRRRRIETNNSIKDTASIDKNRKLAYEMSDLHRYVRLLLYE